MHKIARAMFLAAMISLASHDCASGQHLQTQVPTLDTSTCPHTPAKADSTVSGEQYPQIYAPPEARQKEQDTEKRYGWAHRQTSSHQSDNQPSQQAPSIAQAYQTYQQPPQPAYQAQPSPPTYAPQESTQPKSAQDMSAYQQQELAIQEALRKNQGSSSSVNSWMQNLQPYQSQPQQQYGHVSATDKLKAAAKTIERTAMVALPVTALVLMMGSGTRTTSLLSPMGMGIPGGNLSARSLTRLLTGR